MSIRTKIPKEYVNKLNEHPCISRATEWTITFTPEFKKIAYTEYYNGKSMREIFKDAGFDVEIIGDKRMQNFRYLLLKKADESNNFEDNRNNNSRKEIKSTEAQMAKRIRELEHRNTYLEQENDFLKKIHTLEKEYSGKEEKQK